MVGFYGGAPLESAGLNEQGSDAVPSSTGEVLGASFGEGLAANLGPRILRSIGRSGADTGLLGVGELGTEIRMEPEAPMDPAAANAEFGIKGHLSFDKPVPRSVAQDLNEHKQTQIEREDTINRRESGILTGGVARFGANIAASILDPINLAVGFIPVVGEAREAALIAQAGSAAARAGVRAGLGGAQGAAAMTALQPLEFALSRQEHEDYTMAMALRSIALGGVLGGGLHAGIGGAIDRATGRYRNPLTQRLEEAGPETRETLLQGALAQSIEGRPVDVAAALDAFDAARAETELGQFAKAQQRSEAQADLALNDVVKTEGVTAGTRAAQDATHLRLTELRQQADSLRGELDQARQQSAAAIDTTTRERLGEIEQELAAPALPINRRASLEAEQRMLTEGSRTTPEADALEQARADAQAQGLAAQLRRTEQQIGKIETGLTKGQTSLAAQEAAANRSFGLQSARVASQQAVISELAARSIRRIAARAGVALEPEQVSALAQRVLQAAPEQAQAEIRAALAEVINRSPRIDGIAGAEPDIAATVTRAAEPLRQSQRQSLAEMFGIARRRPEGDIIAARQADEVVGRAPQIAEHGDAQIAEAQRALDTVMKELQPETAEPRPGGEARPASETVAEHPELREADEMVARAEGDARAYEKAATCLAEMGL